MLRCHRVSQPALEKKQVSRKDRSGVAVMGNATHQFAVRTLRWFEGQDQGTGLLLQLNLVSQAMNKSWVSRNPEAERRTAHTGGTLGWRTTGCSPWGPGGVFCVRLIMGNLFKSNTSLCWIRLVLFAQVLKSVQKLKTETESEQWAVSWRCQKPTHTGSTCRSSGSWLPFYPCVVLKARAGKWNPCLFP